MVRMAHKIDFADSAKERLKSVTANRRAIIFYSGTNLEFMKIIPNARKELRADKKLSLEEMEREFQMAD